jgi:hypothetical protein
MRLVSINSGEVLITNAVSKTIYSTQHNVGVLRFVDAGTKALELENGSALNEPTTYAVRVAIEQAVYDMIIEGEKKGLWRFKKPVVQSAPVVTEEKKDELVQSQTSQEPQRAPEPVSITPIEPSNGKNIETNKIESKEIQQEPKAEANLKPIITQPTLKTNVDLFGPRYLSLDSFVYLEANEKSQRTWLLKRGTKLTILSPGPEGWHFVKDDENRKGYVKSNVLLDHKP